MKSKSILDQLCRFRAKHMAFDSRSKTYVVEGVCVCCGKEIPLAQRASRVCSDQCAIQYNAAARQHETLADALGLEPVRLPKTRKCLKCNKTIKVSLTNNVYVCQYCHASNSRIHRVIEIEKDDEPNEKVFAINEIKTLDDEAQLP